MTLKHDTLFTQKEFLKRMDRYFLGKFNIYYEDYIRAFNYANENWHKLVQNASTTSTKTPIPISIQIAHACNVSEGIGTDIAQSISISRSL